MDRLLIKMHVIYTSRILILSIPLGMFESHSIRFLEETIISLLRNSLCRSQILLFLDFLFLRQDYLFLLTQ